jgi:hypothetical protein
LNQKTCKRLRRMAREIQKSRFDENPNDNPILFRQLLVDPRHQQKLKTQGVAKGRSAVNSPKSFRGIYRALKKNEVKRVRFDALHA